MIRSAALVASLALFAMPAHAAGDPVKGKVVFAKCAACHSIKPGENRIGPSLAGIVGRQVATAPKFNYSPAMKKMNFKWDDARLHQYMISPMKYVPGNRMAFAGIPNPTDRDNVIAYLDTLK